MASNNFEITSDRGLRPIEGARILGIGKSTFDRWAKTKSDFPRGIKLSARVVIYMESDLKAWLAKHNAA
ncbi:AlpA family phage regulatory protein [Paraburkholderia aspalathi]|uniref:helix-turn-helix transcriptional regulator n=1 Tax=Paraburkholderia aspalathi TaxID=1324617 RepID=UPI0038BC18B1